MLFSQDRTQLRRFFFSVWRKHQAREPMEPLEGLIADVIAQHPEYHAQLANEEAALDRDYLPEMGETNPFLHLAMHLAMREQLGTQRPAGIVEIYQKLAAVTGNAHDAEHAMMDCLGEMLWQAQRDGTAPDEQRYLECLEKMVKG
jgi:hypothetical protein